MLPTPGEDLPEAPLAEVGGGVARLRWWPADRPALLFVYKADCAASELGADALPRFASLGLLPVGAISQEGEAGAADFARRHGWAGVVRHFIDPDPWPASEALGVRVTPTWILVDGAGRVIDVREGWSRDDANALAVRAAALAGAAGPGPAPAVSFPEDGPAFRPG